MENIQQGANEVMYKIASHLLSKMQESGLISEEEREKINVLNIEPLLKALASLAVNQTDTEEIEQLDREINSLSEQSRILNQVMKKGYMDSALFMEKSNLLAHRLTECRRKKTLLARKQKRTKEIVRTEQLIGLLKKVGYQREFSEELFDLTVREIRISLTHEITFCLYNGLKLTEEEGGDADAVAHTNRL